MTCNTIHGMNREMEMKHETTYEEDEDTYAAMLHKEILQISNRGTAHRNRFHGSSASEGKVPPNSTEHHSNQFLKVTKEKSIFNQYWYSESTIRVFVEAIEEICEKHENTAEQPMRIAFLSTPSLYFALPMERRNFCKLFEYDNEWANDKGFVPFDFNAPCNIDTSWKGMFDMAIIDPPFITRDVWEKYAIATQYLLKDDPKEKKSIVLGTTVEENADFMMELFHASPTTFKPVVTNLVYQYVIFINCTSTILSMPNPEIQEEEY